MKLYDKLPNGNVVIDWCQRQGDNINEIVVLCAIPLGGPTPWVTHRATKGDPVSTYHGRYHKWLSDAAKDFEERVACLS